MENINDIITEFKSGNVDKNKLEEYLNIDNIAIQFLIINEIHNHNFMTDTLKDRLVKLTENRTIENILWGYSISDFAIALLLANNISNNEINIYKELDDLEKSIKVSKIAKMVIFYFRLDDIAN